MSLREELALLLLLLLEVVGVAEEGAEVRCAGVGVVCPSGFYGFLSPSSV